MNSLSVLFLLNLALVQSQHVIIIGAGPAGIAAATRLLQNNFHNITILEAENRTGGRINSVKFGEKLVDLGAEYCHGENIVYNLVKDLNVLEPITNEKFQPALYYSNGSRLNAEFSEKLQNVILGYDSNNFNESGSVGELFVKNYNATILQNVNSSHEIKLFQEALRLAEKVSLLIDGAFSWLDTSPLKHYERSGGHQLLVWKGRGYKTILQVLTKEFPKPEEKLPIDGKMLFNKQVSGILWAGDKVTLHTLDNASFSAEHVIFTPSLGVLKEQKDALFAPPLPQKKLDAIGALGMDGVMKIILRFDREWWGKEFIFALLWSDEDLYNSGLEFPDGPVKDGVSWVTAVTLLAKVPGNPGVLVAWLAGEFVPEIEQTPDSVLVDGCVYIFKKFLQLQYNVTRPDEILKSTWRSNSHFRGTYSYERFGFERNGVRYQQDLAEPLADKVLFAGEATNPTHYSTVHGAIESGFREADRILKLYNKD